MRAITAEGCDDGNDDAEDGCSDECSVEVGYNCSEVAPGKRPSGVSASNASDGAIAALSGRDSCAPTALMFTTAQARRFAHGFRAVSAVLVGGSIVANLFSARMSSSEYVNVPLARLLPSPIPLLRRLQSVALLQSIGASFGNAFGVFVGGFGVFNLEFSTPVNMEEQEGGVTTADADASVKGSSFNESALYAFTRENENEQEVMFGCFFWVAAAVSGILIARGCIHWIHCFSQTTHNAISLLSFGLLTMGHVGAARSGAMVIFAAASHPSMVLLALAGVVFLGLPYIVTLISAMLCADESQWRLIQFEYEKRPSKRCYACLRRALCCAGQTTNDLEADSDEKAGHGTERGNGPTTSLGLKLKQDRKLARDMIQQGEGGTTDDWGFEEDDGQAGDLLASKMAADRRLARDLIRMDQAGGHGRDAEWDLDDPPTQREGGTLGVDVTTVSGHGTGTGKGQGKGLSARSARREEDLSARHDHTSRTDELSSRSFDADDDNGGSDRLHHFPNGFPTSFWFVVGPLTKPLHFSEKEYAIFYASKNITLAIVVAALRRDPLNQLTFAVLVELVDLGLVVATRPFVRRVDLIRFALGWVFQMAVYCLPISVLASEPDQVAVVSASMMVMCMLAIVLEMFFLTYRLVLYCMVRCYKKQTTTPRSSRQPESGRRQGKDVDLLSGRNIIESAAS
jgi:cysteine-rich repeat protein